MIISGYITLRAPTQMNYPYEAAVRSLFSFCDEIVVCDSTDYKNNNDGTKEKLDVLKTEFESLKDGNIFKVVVPDVDWSKPNHGIYDGLTKAFARKNCTGDFCFQIDADEVVDTTRAQMERMCGSLTKNEVLLMALPVVEYWGSEGKVRIDVNPWKWRLSVNSHRITHGIPGHLRKQENGLLYAMHGTDGCDYIDSVNHTIIPCMGFMTGEAENTRRLAVFNEEKAKQYEGWFNRITSMLPTVYHFSWWSVYEKMKKYKLFWNDSWITLYNEKRPDGYNPFFNKPFANVTEEEMKETARRLESDCGGFIFHNPVDINNIPRTLSVNISKSPPIMINTWTNSLK